MVSTGNTNVNAQYKAGQVRILAIVDKEECVFVPGVKTLEAQDYKVYAPTGSGIIAPAGTP